MLIVQNSSKSVYSEDEMKKIGNLIYEQLSQLSLFAKMEQEEMGPLELDLQEQEEEIIEVCVKILHFFVHIVLISLCIFHMMLVDHLEQ